MKVFIVDDHPWYVTQLTELVTAIPGACVVGSAGTAYKAKQAIAACAPQVVLLDLMLLQGSGIEVLRAIRTKKLNIQVFMVASLSSAGIRKACLTEGADEFFDKLLDLDKLRVSLQKLALTFNPKTNHHE